MRAVTTRPDRGGVVGIVIVRCASSISGQRAYSTTSSSRSILPDLTASMGGVGLEIESPLDVPCGIPCGSTKRERDLWSINQAGVYSGISDGARSDSEGESKPESVDLPEGPW